LASPALRRGYTSIGQLRRQRPPGGCIVIRRASRDIRCREACRARVREAAGRGTGAKADKGRLPEHRCLPSSSLMERNFPLPPRRAQIGEHCYGLSPTGRHDSGSPPRPTATCQFPSLWRQWGLGSRRLTGGNSVQRGQLSVVGFSRRKECDS
jgi:hypothetical protein